uniref:SFRICE_010435 n=1 Tax=Spodoptera frugiperda TaxID=7108 RepID=A0A2H1V5J0_SPOFR
MCDKSGRAMLRHEWAGSTGVIPRPHRKPSNALVKPLVFQVAMGGGDCLPSVSLPSQQCVLGLQVLNRNPVLICSPKFRRLSCQWPLLTKALFSHGEDFSINHYTSSRRIGDLKLRTN